MGGGVVAPASDTSLLPPPPAEAVASFRTPASGISRGMRCFVGIIMPALRGLLDFPRWAQGRRDERRRGRRGGLAAARRSDGSSVHAGESALKDASERV